MKPRRWYPEYIAGIEFIVFFEGEEDEPVLVIRLDPTVPLGVRVASAENIARLP